MSLYTYVPGRDELLELMVNRVHAELAPAAEELPWRADVEHQVGERWRRDLSESEQAAIERRYVEILEGLHVNEEAIQAVAHSLCVEVLARADRSLGGIDESEQ